MMEALNELLEWLNDFDNKPFKPTYSNMREKVWQLMAKQKQTPIANNFGICSQYEPDNTTAMNCRYCGKGKYFHTNNP